MAGAHAAGAGELARAANHFACEGARLIQRGRPAQAVTVLQRSVALDPGVAAAQHDLGVAMIAVRRFEEAAAAFAAAARLNPSLAAAHYNLGYALDSLGRTNEALASYEAAVRLAPGEVRAQARLGDLYLVRERFSEAETAYRAVVAAQPETVVGAIAEACAAGARGEPAEALSQLQALVMREPRSAEAHMTLGRFLAHAGRSTEAAEHFEKAATLSPALSAAWYGVATNRKFTSADGPVIARMNAALSRRDLTPAARQALHFALGKAHDDTRRYGAAMRHFDEANRLRSRSLSFNRAALARRIDQLIADTPPGYFDQTPFAGADEDTPILIVGMPRSGTTLVEQILSSHPRVTAGGELGFWAARDVPRADTWSIVSNPETLRRLADDYLALLRRIGPDARRVTDKAPFNFPLLGVIHRVFPRATLIHCTRDPIDTCLSIFTTSFEMTFDFAADRGDLVFFYRQYQRLMAHWRAVLPQDRLVGVDYETLVSDPEPQIRRLVAACGLDWDEACLRPQNNARRIATASMWQARQPIYQTSIERWRRYEPWLGELRELAPES